jgi:hypothetical protein
MAKLDYSKYDLQVTITADPRRGLWASSLLNHGIAIRKGGQLPTEAHAHTLLLVALTNTLRGVTRGEYEKLQHMKAVVKPRVKVIVSGRGIVNTFAAAFAGILARDKDAPKLRAGRNFLAVAAQQAMRFSIEIENTGNAKELVLLTWVQKLLYPESSFERLPAALLPQIAGQMIRADV